MASARNQDLIRLLPMNDREKDTEILSCAILVQPE